jgi:hypothetical protein
MNGQLRKRRRAQEIGRYEPRSPLPISIRTQLVHEWSPAEIRHLLRKRFPHVVVWVGSEDNPYLGLTRSLSLSEAAACRHVFAIASYEPFAASDLMARLEVTRLPVGDAASFSLEQCGMIETRGDTVLAIPIRVSNRSSYTIGSLTDAPVLASYHLLSPDGQILQFDGRRTALPYRLQPGAALSLDLVVDIPIERRQFAVRLCLVQEGVTWIQPDDSLIQINLKA